jgi:hypothetical protein
MFSPQPGLWSALRLGVYLATIAAITSLTGWSAYRVGATIVALLDTKIVDGSGRAVPEADWSAPPFASDPRIDQSTDSAGTATTAISHLTSATAGPLATPPRVSSDQPEDDPAAAFHNGNENTYKTYCVRLCDGFYWPISFSTTPDKFEDDASACWSSCGSPARLFVHSIPGGGPATMVSLEGLPYAALKTAFLFRVRYDSQCRCQAQPWEEAAKNRHKLFAAAEAAKTGDQTAIAEALRLKAKVVEDTRAQVAARETAEKSAEIELTKLSQTASLAPPERSARRRPAVSRRDTGVIRLGALEADAEPPQKRGFKAASGSGRSWTDRVFGDN